MSLFCRLYINIDDSVLHGYEQAEIIDRLILESHIATRIFIVVKINIFLSIEVRDGIFIVLFFLIYNFNSSKD